MRVTYEGYPQGLPIKLITIRVEGLGSTYKGYLEGLLSLSLFSGPGPSGRTRQMTAVSTMARSRSRSFLSYYRV